MVDRTVKHICNIRGCDEYGMSDPPLLVTHAITGARGEVHSWASLDVRVRWEPNNRIYRHELKELRMVDPDDYRFNHSYKTTRT